MSELLPAWTPIRFGDGRLRGYQRYYGCMTAEVLCDGDPEWVVCGGGLFLGPYGARSVQHAAKAAVLVAKALDRAFDIAAGADEEARDE